MHLKDHIKICLTDKNLFLLLSTKKATKSSILALASSSVDMYSVKTANEVAPNVFEKGFSLLSSTANSLNFKKIFDKICYKCQPMNVSFRSFKNVVF
ncbi:MULTISPECIES: hypothetical protein [Clostridium]|uniref:hypothetical protein n=1 Tax=Clostridium TaxID=1485 RepID=UPI0007745562|nr:MULTISPECIES: hypothetical protein [Clostridium]